MQNIYM